MNKKKIAIIVIIAVVALCLICLIIGIIYNATPEGQATNTAQAAVKQTETAAPTSTPGPTSTPEPPTETPEPTATEPPPATDTPEPTITNTPEPEYVEPVELLYFEGQGETVTENYELPGCQKAVFNWNSSSGSIGFASLILTLYRTSDGENVTLVNEFGDAPPDGMTGQVLQPLGGGEYYFTTENTDETWNVSLICQDFQAPTTGIVEIQGTGNTVTDNYEIPACSKSVFTYSVLPNSVDFASIILRLVAPFTLDSETLANEFASDVPAEGLTGQALQPVGGGHYFFTVENLSGPWTIAWECQD